MKTFNVSHGVLNFKDFITLTPASGSSKPVSFEVTEAQIKQLWRQIHYPVPFEISYEFTAGRHFISFTACEDYIKQTYYFRSVEITDKQWITLKLQIPSFQSII